MRCLLQRKLSLILSLATLWLRPNLLRSWLSLPTTSTRPDVVCSFIKNRVLSSFIILYDLSPFPLFSLLFGNLHNINFSTLCQPQKAYVYKYTSSKTYKLIQTLICPVSESYYYFSSSIAMTGDGKVNCILTSVLPADRYISSGDMYVLFPLKSDTSNRNYFYFFSCSPFHLRTTQVQVLASSPFTSGTLNPKNML